MYESIPFILGAALIILGMILVIMPKQNTKEEKRNISKEVYKTKRTGCIEIVLGVVLIVTNIIT